MKSSTRQILMLPAIIGVLSVAGIGGAILSDTPHSAIAAEAPAGPPPGGPHAGPGPKGGHGDHAARFMPGRHIEGRIAFLQAELKITPAQKAQWDKVATVMRDNAKGDTAMFEQMRTERTANPGTRPDAVASMNARLKFGEARLANMKKFVEAFTPLYQGLSDDQKKTADELIGHRMRG
jgi:Spy/CpxP family protein refolding chaperone